VRPLLLLLVCACATTTTATTGSTPIVSAPIVSAPIVSAPIEEEAPPLTCDDVPKLATGIAAAFSGCDASTPCVLVAYTDITGPDNCIPAFQCVGAFTEGADLAAMGRVVAPIIQLQRSCDTCAVAACADPTLLEAVCDEVTNRCVVRSR
jgi:hypothetical protein